MQSGLIYIYILQAVSYQIEDKLETTYRLPNRQDDVK